MLFPAFLWWMRNRFPSQHQRKKYPRSTSAFPFPRIFSFLCFNVIPTLSSFSQSITFYASAPSPCPFVFVSIPLLFFSAHLPSSSFHCPYLLISSSFPLLLWYGSYRQACWLNSPKTKMLDLSWETFLWLTILYFYQGDIWRQGFDNFFVIEISQLQEKFLGWSKGHPQDWRSIIWVFPFIRVIGIIRWRIKFVNIVYEQNTY